MISQDIKASVKNLILGKMLVTVDAIIKSVMAVSEVSGKQALIVDFVQFLFCLFI